MQLPIESTCGRTELSQAARRWALLASSSTISPCGVLLLLMLPVISTAAPFVHRELFTRRRRCKCSSVKSLTPSGETHSSLSLRAPFMTTCSVLPAGRVPSVMSRKTILPCLRIEAIQPRSSTAAADEPSGDRCFPLRICLRVGGSLMELEEAPVLPASTCFLSATVSLLLLLLLLLVANVLLTGCNRCGCTRCVAVADQARVGVVSMRAEAPECRTEQTSDMIPNPSHRPTGVHWIIGPIASSHAAVGLAFFRLRVDARPAALRSRLGDFFWPMTKVIGLSALHTQAVRSQVFETSTKEQRQCMDLSGHILHTRNDANGSRHVPHTLTLVCASFDPTDSVNPASPSQQDAAPCLDGAVAGMER